MAARWAVGELLVNETNPIESLTGLRKFKPYPAYKDSGIEWLEKIPADWDVSTLKRIASIRYGLGEPPPQLPGGLPFIRATNVTKGRIVDDGMQFVDPQNVPWNRNPGLKADDIIVVRSGAYTGDSAIIPEEYDGAIAGYDMVVRPHGCQASFLGWTLLSRYVLEAQLELKSTRAAQPHLNAEELGMVVVLFPPDSEQRAIAAFLHRETAEIDALVAKKERLIELLQEKRAAFITHAVTKGLDPNVPMKDSGVEWLGEIPAHWDVKRTKVVGRLRSGHTPSRQHPEYWQDCTIPWFGLVDVWQIRDGKTEYVYETDEKISELGLANSAARLLPKGTVILSRTASVGFSAIMGVDMATTQDFVNWVCGATLQPEYLLYVFRSMQHEFRHLTMGSTHQTIYMPDVGRFSTPIPPIPEQNHIVAYIRMETAKIDALITRVHGAIDHLKELRTALISAAVTGKIDVREEAA